MLHLLWLLVFSCTVRGQEIEQLKHNSWTNRSAVDHSGRGVSDPLFNIIRLNRVQCAGAGGQQGTCYSRLECSSLQGTISGKCAYNWGVCCIIYRSCDSSTKVNSTYFTNPGFPAMSKNLPWACPITVTKTNSNICQLRIDFLDFTLVQPDANGDCVDDYLQVKDSAFAVPKICGENSDQHVYVHFQPGNIPIQLNILTRKSLSGVRKWNLKITQIECTSPYRAPPGYLMYFRGTEGHVKSFNYPQSDRSGKRTFDSGSMCTQYRSIQVEYIEQTSVTVQLQTGGPRQLAHMKYGVGVQQEPGYCSIEWMQDPTDPYSFTVSEDTDIFTVNQLGTSEAAVSGTDCTTDFIVIPDPSQDGASVLSDRFCGNALLPTATSAAPFVLTVVTDGSEVDDMGNRGFSLTYRQIRC